MAARLTPRSPYDSLFDPNQLSTRIKDHSFGVTKRSPAKNLEGNNWLQKGSLSPWVEYGEAQEILDKRSDLTDEELTRLDTPEGIVNFNQEGIELALDRRVALFFQQCILCYKMPFIFSTQGADDQFGSARAVHLSNKGSNKKVHKREAAHSSTIPTLLARDKNDREGRTFVYLKGGSSHAQHNATIGMHVHINGADELLDGVGKGGLRSASIKILNQVAEGLSPTQATKDFLKKFEKKAETASQHLDPNDTRKLVLRAYIQGIQNIAQNIESDPTIFNRLIGVTIDPDDPKEAILRKTIYERRYDIIRLEEVLESSIAKRIDDAKQEMQSRDRSFLEYILLKEFSETNQRKVLEKLFAKTAVIFEEEYKDRLSQREKSSFKSFQTRVRNLQQKYPNELLNNLKRDLRYYFREFSSSELIYRAKIFRDLRTKVRDWTQVEFCDHHYEITGKKVCQAWVSRMERAARKDLKTIYKTPPNQRGRPVTLQDAKDCAKTFDIDVGLFLPCLITSDYS